MIINGVEIFRREDDIHYIISGKANKQGPWLLRSNLGRCVLWYIRYILQYRWREKVFKGTCVYRELHQKKRTGVHKSSEYNGKRSLFVSRRDNALRYSLSRISFFFYVFISILHQIPAVKHDCKRPIIHKGNFHIGTKLPLLDHRDFFAAGFQYILIHRLCHLRSAGVCKRWTVSLFAVGI